MSYIRFMFYFRMTLGLVWAALLVLVTYGSTIHGDEGLLSAYGFLFLTFPFGLIWAYVAHSPAAQLGAAAEIQGMIAVDVFTLFFWLILVPMLWGRYQRMAR